MPDQAELFEVFAAFAHRATGEFVIEDILTDLASAAGRVLEVDGAGVAYRDGERMRAVHGSNPPVRDAEQAQSRLQQGPCQDARDTGELVVEPDLPASCFRWPEYAEQVLSLGLHSVASVPLVARGEVWGALDLYRSTTGPFRPADLTAATMLADVAVSYVVMAHDRDTATAAQAESAHAATHDPLTGLPNRLLLYDRLEHALMTGRRRGRQVAVLFLDLDGFKAINDTHGHHVGDLLLVEVASRLTGALRGGDTLARLGGDEFVIVCENFGAGSDGSTPGAALARVRDRVESALAGPMLLDGREIEVSASIGLATADEGSEDADALLRAADSSMYSAKRAGQEGVAG